jgi:NAD+ kinase
VDRYLLVVNKEKDEEHHITARISGYLKAHGASCVVADGMDFITLSRNEKLDIIGEAGCILVLGGDGTLLSVASATEDIDIPLFGINLGTVGFLTEGELANIEPVLDRLLKDEFSIEERMMIQGRIIKNGRLVREKGSLNDIVVTRAGFSRLIGLNVYVNGGLLDTYEADGVVVATPTGSTGYNLSAGGPIVSPYASLIVVTPVSPHSLTSKSIVLSGNDKITIEIVKKRKTQDTEAIVSFDGGTGTPLAAGDIVEIEQMAHITKLIKANDINFYEILRNKLGGK